MFEITNFAGLKKSILAESAFAMRVRLLFGKRTEKSIAQENIELREKIKNLRAEISEMSRQLGEYGKKEIEEYMSNERLNEANEMLDFINAKEGFRYTHRAAEQRINMLEKEVENFRKIYLDMRGAYTSLEREWLRYLARD